MTCYDIGLIQAYIDGELSLDTRKKLIQHLDTCEACQKSLLEISKLNQWENLILDEEFIHSTQEVKIDVEQAWKTFESHSQLENVFDINHKIEKKKELFTNMNKKSKRLIYTAVAVAGLFTTAMIPQVQAMAINVASYFSNVVLNDTVVNEGMIDENGVKQDMTKNGQFTTISEKITDQGITVHFKGLYVADQRISVHYNIEKSDGSIVPYEFDTTELDLKSDGKVNGQQKENPEYNTKDGFFSRLAFIQGTDGLPFELMAAGKKIEAGVRDTDRPEGVVTFALFEKDKESFNQPLTLDVDINRIGNITGSWKGQIQIKK
ncbi:zf-HC2 domain-containing protein [Brevibacterium sp. JNUCC-42]|nr:zf-HC2 domain-containing protein [Brevibacterium sp. JNUCC-42]